MTTLIEPIATRNVRYIKLGEGGKWEKECVKNGIVRFGFDTGEADTLKLCLEGKWDALRADWLRSKTPSIATNFTNQTKFFFEDSGNILWITFVEDRLYWGFLEPGKPQACDDGDSSFRRVLNGWNCHDVIGQGLTKSRLSGAITKLAAYPATSCWVDVADKVVARINAKKLPEVEHAIEQYIKVSEALLPLVKSLRPKDFEDLVDLIFAASGWRRIGRVGGTQRTIDFDLELPSTGERAFVQVKSRTNQSQFDEYVERMEQTSASKMFFVHHTGVVRSADPRAIPIDGRKLVKMAVDAGLTDWIIQKAS